MNTRFDTSDAEQSDTTGCRKTLVRSRNSNRAANSASIDEDATAPQIASVLDDTTRSDKSDPRKVYELNADDFFKLGKFRI